jgi:hypothetical protein
MGMFEPLGGGVRKERDPTAREQAIRDKAVKKEQEAIEMAEKTTDMETLMKNLWDDFMGSTRSEGAYKKLMKRYRETNPALMSELGKNLDYINAMHLAINSVPSKEGDMCTGYMR